MTTVTEIKHRPGREDSVWTCEAVELRPPEFARILYTTVREWNIDGVVLPVGTTTDAVYWSDRPYHAWHFRDPEGTHLGFRFDVCTDTLITPTRIEWTDLVLDLWIPAGGIPVWQDEDELAQLVAAGSVSPEHEQLALEAKERLSREWHSALKDAYEP